MIKMKRLILFVFTFLTYFVSFAQNSIPVRQFYNISNGWTDLNVSGKIKSKLLWQIENHHRREDMQGDYNEATKTGNPYKTLNQHIIRPYLHYQLNPNVRFSLMPLGWMGSNRYSEGKPSAFFSELRIAPQVILTQNIGRLRFDNRFRYEFRWIGKNKAVNHKSFLYGGDFSTIVYRERFRYQLKMTVPLNKSKLENKTLYLQAYNELFINSGKNVANINIFDQNRVLIGLGYKLNNYVSLEAGFLRQSVYRFNNFFKNNVDRNNILQTNLAITNFEGLFKKK
jgi:Protein of unknown function (DUF2490)